MISVVRTFPLALDVSDETRRDTHKIVSSYVAARFAQPLTSFAFSSASSSRSSYLVGVSTVTGGNGHRLELMPHHNSAFKISTFTESIVLSSASAIRSYPIPFAEPVDESDLPGSTNLLLSSSTPPPTLATLERNRSSSVVYKPDPVGVDGLGALRNDPCVMLHRRAQIGYGGNVSQVVLPRLRSSVTADHIIGSLSRRVHLATN